MSHEEALHYDKWKSLIEEQEKSGLYQGEFCKQKGITLSQLGYYRGILKGKNSQLKKDKPKFSPVIIKKSEPLSIEEIKVNLPNGFKCSFPASIESTQIKKIIEVLLAC
jgi:hypothetical protein